jgi:nicotinate-nucleotide adenylyltransferase
VALYVLEIVVDEVWFSPHTRILRQAPDRVRPPHRDASRSAARRAQWHRAEQELAQKPEFAASRTLDPIEHLYAKYPDVELRLVIGADILGETDKWYRWDDVVRRAPLIVLGRSGYPLPAGAVQSGIVMPEVSATHVRELVAAKDPAAAALLPQAVLRYIARHGLYEHGA